MAFDRENVMKSLQVGFKNERYYRSKNFNKNSNKREAELAAMRLTRFFMHKNVEGVIKG